ncbi:unnamed protein product [Aphis gossypii]|uniref:Uncharacterized protein n=1 Tax=Aphis gossypii TaxID=80765 RepID=A0A9P0IRP7_APHGO|nr:unnamed protein product [Aphis gossypii]
MAEVSRAAAALPKPAIYPGCNDDEFSNALSSDGVDVNCLPTEPVSLESESEARVNSEHVIPILRNVENATVLQLYTKFVIHVEISIPPIAYRNIRNTQSNIDPFDEMAITPADIRNSFEFSTTMLFPWRVADRSSISLFTGEITERRLPKVPLRLGNSIELANALSTSAFLNALQLPITVAFLRSNTDIVSTYFFGGSGTAQIRLIGCESSVLGEVEPSTPPAEVIIERITEFRNSLSAYEPTDEALQSQQSSCSSTLIINTITSYRGRTQISIKN